MTKRKNKWKLLNHEAPKPPPNPNFAQQPMASILKAGLPSSSSQSSTTRAPPPQLPPIRYAAAAAAAVTPSTSAQSITTNATSTTTHSSPQNVTSPHEASEDKATSSLSSPQANRTISQDTYNAVLSSPSLTHPSTNSPLLSSTSAQLPDGSTSFDSPVLSEAAESNVVESESVSASAAGEGNHRLFVIFSRQVLLMPSLVFSCSYHIFATSNAVATCFGECPNLHPPNASASLFSFNPRSSY